MVAPFTTIDLSTFNEDARSFSQELGKNLVDWGFCGIKAAFEIFQLFGKIRRVIRQANQSSKSIRVCVDAGDVAQLHLWSFDSARGSTRQLRDGGVDFRLIDLDGAQQNAH